MASSAQQDKVDVTLINFKSFKGETKVFIEDGTTVIVGRNGAGKSNFLNAIDFVLGSRHAHLSRLSRPKLLNTSDNRASIEVVLHDEDQLFQSEELVIKREFDFKQDEFYLNGLRLQKSELIVLLEVLGFSRPTAYHACSIIQLKELVFSSTVERLNALINYLGSSVALTVSFMRKLLPDLDDWGSKMNLLEEQVKNQNPDEIRAEMARQQTFSTLSKMKSALRFRLSCLRKESWKNLMEVELNTTSLKAQNAQALHSLKSDIGSCKIALKKAESDAFSEKMLLDGYIRSREIIAKTLDSLNLSANENEYQLEMEELNISVVDTVEVTRSVQERIQELENSLTIEEAVVNELCEKLCEEEQNRNDLLLMLNCNEKFSTSQAKARWIETTVRQFQIAYGKNVEEVKMCEKRKKSVKNSITECENRIKHLDHEQNASLNALEQLASMKLKLNEMQVELHNLSSQENVILNDMGVLMSSLKSKKTELNCKIGNSTMNGMLSVQSVRDSWISTNPSFASGCYGTIMDNIECSPALNSALEAAIGSRLFSQIVDTDTIGTAILQEMKSKELPGEVVFLPLNRIMPHESPRVKADGVEHLMSQLSYPINTHAAISHLFGRTLLCRDLEIATKVAKEYHCVCVTVQGDRVVGSGPMTGGYVDCNAASRTLYQAYKSLQTSYAEKIEDLRTKRDEKCCLKASMDSFVVFIQRGEIKNLDGDQYITRKMLMDRLEILKKNESHLREQIKTKERDNVLLLRKQKTLEEFCHEDFSGTKSQDRLRGFNKKVFELEKEFNQRSANLHLMTSEISLLRAKESCSNMKKDTKVAGVSKCKAIRQKLEDQRAKEKLLSSRLRVTEEDIALSSANLNSYNQKVAELKSELKTLKDKMVKTNLLATGLDTSGATDSIKAYQDKINDEHKIMLLEAKNTEPELVHGLIGLSLEELQIRLTNITRELEEVRGTLKMSSTALQHEVKYLNLKDDFDSAKDDLMTLFPLKDLLHLWIQQHVSKSLEYVSNLFEHYFRLMVPNNRGAMLIKRSAEDPVLGFEGVDLELMFGGNIRLPSVLSAGQKMVTMLAIVFAVMACRRSCFCVLDEADQALSNERLEGLFTAISDSVTQGHQFLITSHNTYMVRRGHHHFAIEFKRGGSNIQPVSSTEAISVTESIGVVDRRPSQSTSLTSSQSTMQSSQSSFQQ